MQPKCAIFSQKSQKFSGQGAQPPPQALPLGREIPLTRPLTLGIYLCTYFFVFFGHCTYKSSHGKALIWSGKVMEIDFSKVVGTVLQCRLLGISLQVDNAALLTSDDHIQ